MSKEKNSTEETPEKVRAGICDFLRSRMIGPFGGENEIIEDEAFDYYHYGFLTPPNVPFDKEEEEDNDAEELSPEKGASDSVMTMANAYRQGSLAISFQIAADYSGDILLEARWGEYDVSEINGPESQRNKESSSGGSGTDKKGEQDREYRWKRRPMVYKKKLSCSDSLNYNEIREDGIRVNVRERTFNDLRFVTYAFVNNRGQLHRNRLKGVTDEKSAKKIKDNNVYQVVISAKNSDEMPLFVARPASLVSFDEERWNDELLFRAKREFGVGHGCSVDWEPATEDRSKEIRSAWIPSIEIQKASTRIEGEGDELKISSYCNESSRNEACTKLKSLPDAYRKWIDGIRDEVSVVATEFGGNRARIEEVCERNIANCNETCDRIYEGIRLLETDELVWAAFCFANRVIHKNLSKKIDEQPRWRAFQLGFILSSLPSTLDSSHEMRDMLDLIWFPTGGGKTEAYLGLSALLIAHTRLVHPGKKLGTTILTRYTLRLLTVQQFERTAQMICECESLRKKESEKFGKEPITCGIFVGANATPNRLKDASDLIAGKPTEAKGTTLPISQCPFCGTDFDHSQQRVDGDKLVTGCRSKDCEFHEEIPVAFVDDHIYAHPPTIVVGTIDKFASLAWDERIKAILGGGGTLPPQLIIQDELHLISDSLGTLAALYETAMDYICRHKGVRPKVIGSTATIRRANEQCHGIFDRNIRQFPPAVVDIEDSFFNRSDTTVPGRLYVGINAQGRSPKSTLIWVMGILAQAATASRIKNENIRDAFHTQVVYFNSLRELGGAYVAAEDDVPKFIETISQGNPRSIAEKMELTSGVGEIREALAKLSTSINSDDINRSPLDLVLTTNMISVGIDVDRLGLMVINGQPKSTSEYIQASSRVGRGKGEAGLIVTIYNPNRSRDKSHYERFRSYHQTFYRYVEAVSVTPFADRARDKALHAVLIAMCRQIIPELAAREDAGKIANSQPLMDKVEKLKNVIVERVKSVDPSEADATAKELSEIIRDWKHMADLSEGDIVWRKQGQRDLKQSLLKRPEQKKPNDGRWKTLLSMRDVQEPTPVYINPRF